MARGGGIESAAPLTGRRELDRSASTLATVTGAPLDEARGILDGLATDDPQALTILARMFAEAWRTDSMGIVERLLPSTGLERPRRRGIHRPTVEQVIQPEDWFELIRTRWPAVGRWNESDWAIWLNGLIRARVQVEPDRPSRRAPTTSGPGSLGTYARSMFFVGR